MVVKNFIDNYQFGSIRVNNINYTSDLIITPTGVISNWWRKEGHYFVLEDIPELDWMNVNSVIIGTGWSGLMQVHQSVLRYLEQKKIPFIIKPSPVAVKEFNRYINNMKLGFFHLTC